MNPFALIEQQWWLGLPAAFLMGVALGGSPLALPVMAAGVGLSTAASAREGARRYWPVIGFGVGLAAVYGALGLVADRIDLVFERALSRTGGIAAAVLGVLLVGAAVILLARPRSGTLACRPLWRRRTSGIGAFLTGIPAGIFGCPACSGVIIGVAGSAALIGHTAYSVAAMTALGAGHASAVLLVTWFVQRGVTVEALATHRAQRIAAVLLLVVGGWLLYLAYALDLSVGPRLP
jgi:cytochrome c-type biogenesis protein